MPMTTRRATLVALASMLALAGCGGDTGGGSGGGCVGPTLTTGDVAIPGADLAIHGEAFIDGCVDTAVNGTPHGTSAPYESVEVVLTQAEAIVLSEVATPDADGSFDLTLALPTDLGPEPITITAPDIIDAEVVTIPVQEP